MIVDDDVASEYLPLPVGPEDTRGDSVTSIDQHDESTIVCPVDEVQLTHLAIERIVGDIQLARGHELTTWNPLD